MTDSVNSAGMTGTGGRDTVGQEDAAGGGALAVDQLQVPALRDPFEQPRARPERDRVQAQHDYDTNIEAKEEIETILKELARLELEKLDKIMELLQKKG